MRLSALEQVPLFDGSTPRQALEDMVSLARGLEEMDFHRFWIAEHHNTPVFMSSAPELVMTHLLDRTSRIRIGSGGVMAMHQGSLQMAEKFFTLATLFPGRVDMGLGRAPGGDMISARALNQGTTIDPQSINALIDETLAFMRGTLPEGHPYASVGVYPRPEELPELWLLGSSGQSAAWTGTRNMNYAYAQFFSGQQQPEVMDHYRAHLPENLAEGQGQTLSALAVSAAETEAEALEQALPALSFRMCLRLGRPVRFQRPEQMSAEDREDALRWAQRDRSIIIGTYDQVAQTIANFARNHRVDEVMLISYIADVPQKLAQYQELQTRLG